MALERLVALFLEHKDPFKDNLKLGDVLHKWKDFVTERPDWGSWVTFAGRQTSTERKITKGKEPKCHERRAWISNEVSPEIFTSITIVIHLKLYVLRLL